MWSYTQCTPRRPPRGRRPRPAARSAYDLGVTVVVRERDEQALLALPLRLAPRSWGASTSKQMCIQADLDDADALRHMNKNNSERPVCITHPIAPISTSFLFVFDTAWVMSTSEHQGRDTVLQTGLKIHWSRRSASSCFNRVWRVTKSSAKHQSMLSPWVRQHQPWPSPSAWTKTRSLHGCRNFYLLILPSLSFSLSLSLSLLLILDRTDVCSPLLRLFPTQFGAKIDFSRKK